MSLYHHHNQRIIIVQSDSISDSFIHTLYLNVHITDNPIADSPQKDDQTQSELKANEGK